MKYMCVYPDEIVGSTANYEYAGIWGAGRLVEEPWDQGMRRIGVTKNILIMSKEGDYDWLTEVVDNIEVSVFISDSRIGFYCEQYDKGSSWWGIGGGAVAALIMTQVSKARAAKRTEGTALIGHIRYEWLSQVSYHPKTTLTDDEEIGLDFWDTDNNEWHVCLGFAKGTNVRGMANDILRRACMYKLAMTDAKKPEDTATLVSYCRGEQIEHDDREYYKLGLSSESDDLHSIRAPEGVQYRPEPNAFARYMNAPFVPPVPANQQQASIRQQPAAVPQQAVNNVPPFQQSVPVMQKRYCASCRFDIQELPNGAKFCPKCGAKL